MLPFSHDAFVAVFAAYNRIFWPAEMAAFMLAPLLVALVLWPSRARSRALLALLALQWLFTGIVYLGLFLAKLSPAGYVFAGLFAAEGLLLLGEAVRGGGPLFAPRGGLSGILGAGLLVYAGFLYPLIGRLLGPGYPAVPAFGITPCPLVLFTLGLFLLTAGRVGAHLLAVPLLWTLVGGSAAFLLAIPQDWVLLASGPAMIAALASRRGASGVTSGRGVRPGRRRSAFGRLHASEP
ncbi:DUF6064 family protein [Propylenella binzhouense]|uniref:Uncharacterized protein n=1 Tax=Propylenella binzhouense TaxID=2555902 RepID=A0A964T4L6_9HYPH|nr:DUF6064 family protein [Propylenella binzhouense]MYZ48358.1 hypothetical protein [Propylenella binzhouense]